MLTNDERDSQIRSQVKKDFDQEQWKHDVHRYCRFKKMMMKHEERKDFFEKRLKKIREKYPNVKDWP